jgi:hypothetical protein
MGLTFVMIGNTLVQAIGSALLIWIALQVDSLAFHAVIACLVALSAWFATDIIVRWRAIR